MHVEHRALDLFFCWDFLGGGIFPEVYPAKLDVSERSGTQSESKVGLSLVGSMGWFDEECTRCIAQGRGFCLCSFSCLVVVLYCSKGETYFPRFWSQSKM